MPVALVLVGAALSGREHLEPGVRNRLTTINRQAVRSRRQTLLGSFHGRQLCQELLATSLVELVVLEIFGIHIARLETLRGLKRTFGSELCERVLDSCAFAGEEFVGAVRVHDPT